DQQLSDISQGLDIPVRAVDTEHFLTQRMELKEMFRGKKTYLMETFYRAMRRKYQILMEDETSPLTGQWNYDSDNRNRYDGKVAVPDPALISREVSEMVEMVKAAGVQWIGRIDSQRFMWPVTREEALEVLEEFLEHRLPWFGVYQDAMSEDHWALFHARISFPLNVKLLHPLEVVERAVAHWQKNQDKIDMAQIEGFVRQIVGWREYMRGVYWAHMPSYASTNFFEHNRPLPHWYWTGDTHMNCLRHSIHNSLDHGYAHHIQRLMITGNFALLAGISPDELDQWYLGIYLDAIEWVEITNTRGMSQYADGGIVGSKPYVSSANYIDKMSDYCKGCHYDKKLRHGVRACPFNSLYWHFYERNRATLEGHPRIGFVYRNLGKMTEQERFKTISQAETYLKEINSI
ncbi:MAG: cryptochrome/photolyase family protein, partial [Bacteroidia bacterium]|nr:cryptochrome/photolyase family protein [Bacteroidia bacterium]